MRQIILASTSPRRKEILSKTGLKFTVVASDFEEDMTLELKPLALAKYLSRGKAEAVARKYTNHIVIAADTFVALGQELLGKPKTVPDAKCMLKKISGRSLSIITGYTIIDTATKKRLSRAVTTKALIKKLSAAEIERYVKTNEPLDKAGAFAIQGVGAVMIKKINGDFYGAVGLPLFDLAESLKKFGVQIL